MKLAILAIGRMKAGPERELLRRYVERSDGLGRTLRLGPVQSIEVEESRARDEDTRKREEASAVQGRIPASADLVLLDERGEAVDSAAFAALIGNARDRGMATFAFGIGGPDGWAPSLRDAHRTIAFGRATFPHQLVRVLLVEQIYRALTILAGHPYHRA